jgi:hypothetical protein
MGLMPDEYRQMGSAVGLSDGRAELRRYSLEIGQDDGARPQTGRTGKAGAGEANPQEGRSLIQQSSFVPGRSCHWHNLHLSGI